MQFWYLMLKSCSQSKSRGLSVQPQLESNEDIKQQKNNKASHSNSGNVFFPINRVLESWFHTLTSCQQDSHGATLQPDRALGKTRQLSVDSADCSWRREEDRHLILNPYANSAGLCESGCFSHQACDEQEVRSADDHTTLRLHVCYWGCSLCWSWAWWRLMWSVPDVHKLQLTDVSVSRSADHRDKSDNIFIFCLCCRYLSQVFSNYSWGFIYKNVNILQYINIRTLLHIFGIEHKLRNTF